jgi:predicted dehydrogenase
MDCYREAIEFIHSGRLGRISEVRAWNFENLAPAGYGRPPDSPPPPGLDWDFWLGPAPSAAYNPNRYHQFHFFWDYGGGWQCDWGVHMFDVIHWAMKVDSPLSATGVGGRFSRQDNTEYPDTFEAVFEYPGFVALYSYRHGNGRPFEGMWYGNAFYGEDGTLVINRDGWQVIPEPHESHDPSKGLRMGARQGPATPVEGPHQRRFIDAVKSGKAPEGADVLTGQRSTVPGHLANISYRIGRKIRWDAGKETIKDDPPANALLGPAYREPWVLPT